VVGIVKSVWKGNAQALVARVLGSIDPWAMWMLPGAAAWVFVEGCLMLWRMGGGAPRAWKSHDGDVRRWAVRV